MQKRELLKAADRLLGPDFKLKPFRRMRVDNPDYKAKSVNWLFELKGNSGELRIVVGSKENSSVISVPCGVFKEDLFGERMIIEIPREILVMFNRRFIEYVSKSVSNEISGQKNHQGSFNGTLLVPPDILGIPKTVIAEELSLEGLQAEGFLPNDLKGFRTI